MRYGDNNTIHKTTGLNVEVDEKTGEVVSVWFRCLALPFTVTKVSEGRSEDMRDMYKGLRIKLNAVDFEE